VPLLLLPVTVTIVVVVVFEMFFDQETSSCIHIMS